MAVKVRHHSTGTPTATTASVTVPSTHAGDVVVVVEAVNTAVPADHHITSMTGLGATWSKIPGAVTQTLVAWVGTAPAPSAETRAVQGSGMDLTLAAGKVRRVLTVFVLSGTRNLFTAAYAEGSSGTFTTPPQTANRGHLVIGAGYSNTSTGAISGTSPTEGWTRHGSTLIAKGDTADDDRWVATASRTPGALAAHAVSATRTSGFVAAMTIVVGEVPGPGTVKVMTGHEWVAKPVKRWDGTAWVDSPVRRWNGTAWV